MLRWLLGRKKIAADGFSREPAPVLTDTPIAAEIELYLKQDLTSVIPTAQFTPHARDKEWREHASNWQQVVESLMGNADAELPRQRD
jgi:hypothetical protein